MRSGDLVAKYPLNWMFRQTYRAVNSHSCQLCVQQHLPTGSRPISCAMKDIESDYCIVQHWKNRPIYHVSMLRIAHQPSDHAGASLLSSCGSSQSTVPWHYDAVCQEIFSQTFLWRKQRLFPEQHQQVDLCNGEVLCSLCGTDWILKYYLDALRLQRVNKLL
jgi:hypothetical protein